MEQKGFILLPVIIVIAVVGTIVFFVYQNNKTNNAIEEMKSKVNNNRVATSSPSPKASNATEPTSTATQKPTPSWTPIPTPSPRPFAEEEKMMRKTLAGFEMYVGTGNTAGALTFFTPPQTSNAKDKYEEIRRKNLPYTLKSWSYVTDNNYLLISEAINGGYKVRMTECRSSSESCTTLILEMVRNDNAENGFMIERYYGTEHAYQNNLGEEIKYNGFAF